MKQAQCKTPATQLEAIDYSDPRYVLGARDAAVGVPLDMRQGHTYALGWLEQRLRQTESIKVN